MKNELEFKLIRPARKSGGDRYEYGKEKIAGHMVIYFPQEYSRAEGAPFPIIKVTLEA